jgi:hypothetical protein
MVVVATPALADCGWRTYCRTGDGDTWASIVGPSCVRRWRCIYSWHRRVDYRQHDPRPEDVDDGRRCKWSHWIREAGNDKTTENDARISAQDRWSQAVEIRLGTLYSDVEMAEELKTTCVKKVPTTATATVGASLLGLRHFVCEIEGVPCAPARTDADPAKRRMEKVRENIEKRGEREEQRDRDEARRR